MKKLIYYLVEDKDSPLAFLVTALLHHNSCLVLYLSPHRVIIKLCLKREIKRRMVKLRAKVKI